jgi:hypothetical protein
MEMTSPWLWTLMWWMGGELASATAHRPSPPLPFSPLPLQLQAAMWLGAAVATAVYGELFESMWDPARSNR